METFNYFVRYIGISNYKTEIMSLQALNTVETKAVSTLLINDPRLDPFFSFDGGIELHSTIMLTGTSGAGKTSLAAKLMALMPDRKIALYSREMPAFRVKKQVKRFGITGANFPNALIADKETCATIYDFVEELDRVKPELVFIDSLSVLLKEDCKGAEKEKELYAMIDYLREWVKNNAATLVLIGHETKDGSIKGPVEILYMNDAHMRMVYNEKTGERVTFFTKNRSGETGVNLYYELNSTGMDFFTEDEWAAKVGSQDVADAVYNLVQGFISTLNSNHPNYADFKVAYNSGAQDIISSGVTDKMGVTIAVMQLVDKLTKEHGLIAA